MFENTLPTLARGDVRQWRPALAVAIPGRAAPYDLTNATLTWTAGLGKAGPPAIVKTIGAGIDLDDQTLNPTTPAAGAGRGYFTLTLAPADTTQPPFQAASPLPITLYWVLTLADAVYAEVTIDSGTLPLQATPTR